jgi:hypothetical protein
MYVCICQATACGRQKEGNGLTDPLRKNIAQKFVQKKQLRFYGCGHTGLPDGMFAYQKSHFGYILELLGMENVSILHGSLDYFSAIWYNLWPFGIFCYHLVCCIQKYLAALVAELMLKSWPLLSQGSEICSKPPFDSNLCM